MRIAYFDCMSGISGDMCLGALIDAGADLDHLNIAVASMGLGDVKIEAGQVVKHGFRATHVQIKHPQQHHHRGLADIEALIAKGSFADPAKQLASRIFHLLGQAEAKVHGCSIDKVHFHEVGAIDSIIDITATAIALSQLGIERIEASPVPTGCGTVTIAHGTVGIPAPASAELLQGVPIASSTIAAELTTPTGAAILKSTCQKFGPMPAMTVQAIGCGAGTRDLAEQANVLRVYIGTANQDDGNPLTGNAVVSQQLARNKGVIAANFYEHDSVLVTETNLDDSSAEEIAWCVNQLMAKGAIDVFQSNCLMKKGRLGTMLTVLSPPEIASEIEGMLLEYSSAIGVRSWVAKRTKLLRRSLQVSTAYGPVDGKCVWLPSGRWRFKAEHDCLASLAHEHSVSLDIIKEAAEQAFATIQLAPPA